MTVEERIRISQLLKKMKDQKEYSKQIGLTDSSKLLKKEEKNYEKNYYK